MASRIILITGGNGGLGRAIGQAFLEESQDNRVFLGVRTRREQAERLAADFHGRCKCIELEVTDPDSWQRAVQRILTEHQGLGVLVNNAGKHADSLLATMPPDSWDSVLSTNLDAAFHGCQAVLPTMISQRN